MLFYLYLAATLAPFVLNVLTRQKADAIGLSGLLILGWCLGRVTRLWLEPPEALQFYPVQDLILGAVVFTAWRTQREVWKLALVGLLMFQLCLHTAFWAAWEFGSGQTNRTLWLYMVANNGAYVCMLICAAWGGMVHVARAGLSVVSVRLRGLRHAGP